jgi:hypothetical protein
MLACAHAKRPRQLLVVTTARHNLLQSLLDSIPVVRLQLGDLDVEVLADVREQVVGLAVVDESESSASATETSRATDPVEVGLIIRTSSGQVGDVIVDNHGDGLHVNAAREDVGGDEDLGFASAEPVEDCVTLSAIEGSGQSGDLVAVGCHAALDFGGGVAALDEDDGGSDGHQTVKLEQCFILRFIWKRMSQYVVIEVESGSDLHTYRCHSRDTSA